MWVVLVFSLAALQVTVASSQDSAPAIPFLPTVPPPVSPSGKVRVDVANAIGQPAHKAKTASTNLPTAQPSQDFLEAPPGQSTRVDVQAPDRTTPSMPSPVANQESSQVHKPPAGWPASSKENIIEKEFKPALDASSEVPLGPSLEIPQDTTTPPPANGEPRMPPTLSKGPLSLDEILEVWEPVSVSQRWSGWLRALRDPSWGGMGASPDHPTWKVCSDHVAAYLESLRQGRAWAVMLSDASGRAPRGLFDGNGYWLGSRALCEDLDPTSASSGPGHRSWGGSPFHRNDVDPTRDPGRTSHSVAPFPLAFFVAKLAVNLVSPDLRLSQASSLGLCLPASCSSLDVSRLLRAAIRRPDAVRLRGVRRLVQDYDFWADRSFHFLAAAGGLVTLVVLAATVFDLVLEYKTKPQVGGDSEKAAKVPDDPNNHNNIKNKDVGTDIVHQSTLTSGPALWQTLFLSLSARTNLRKILSLHVGEDALAPVHGLRVLSLLWVILAHVALIMFHLADNKEFREKAEADFLYQALSSGTFSVDTFFFLSGLLLSYLYFRSCGGRALPGGWEGFKGRCVQFGGMMLYRFVRLTPPYMFVLGVVQVSMRHFHAHAVADLPSRDHETCPQFWWRNLLYINTFFPNSERCMTWSWYLAVDTQFYAVGCILLIIAISYFWTAVATVAVFTLSSWVTTAVVAYSSHHVTNFKEPFAHYDELYDKPWTRLGPYLVGLCTGWLLWRKACRIRMHPVLVCVGWLVSATTLVGCVFGLYGSRLSPSSSAAYVALSHTAWAVAVAWVLVACLTGHGGWVDAILSWRGMYPASRLCYCAYLLHPQLMRSMALHADSAFHMSRDHVAVLFVGFCVASFSLALVLSLVLEAPVVSLLSVLRPRVGLLSRAPRRPPHASPGCPGRPLPVPHMPESWTTAGFGY